MSRKRAELTVGQKVNAIKRIQRRIEELKAFDVQTLTESHTSELNLISRAIYDTLSNIFGTGSDEYIRYSDAIELDVVSNYNSPSVISIDEMRNLIQRNKNRSIMLLSLAIESLTDDIETRDIQDTNRSNNMGQKILSRKIFIVHGHDEHAREAVARFVEGIGFEAIILHEQANQGRTIIEMVEAHGDVGFAIVLLTPDDFGGPKGGNASPRARQNVILELGYFIGRLGRRHVCALKSGDMELPSDFSGVLYKPFDTGEGWKLALVRELQGTGFDIDLNKVFRRN